MKTVASIALQAGMVLGEDVRDRQGDILFSADAKVDSTMIERLKRYSIMCVTVKEDVDLAATHHEKIRYDENFKSFERQFQLALNIYKAQMLAFMQSGQKIADEDLLRIYFDLKPLVSTGGQLLDYLYNMTPNEDELTFTHCLSSALLAGTFADWLAMDEEARRTLILCGFYYDIGKLRLPYELLWKPGKLTEEEFRLVKTHPVIGYGMVKNLDLDSHVKNAVIMHHERLDGSGYPYHMRGGKIDLYARYIAIVDAYIAMASPRSYRNSLTPLQVLGNLEQSIDKYDVELLMPLMKRIADAQTGTCVQLSDDTVWEVLIIHSNRFSRPILRNDSSEILDLLMRPDLEIVKNL